jgi:hypothetical protein
MFKWMFGVMVLAAAGQCGAQVARCMTPRGDVTYSNLGCAQYEKAQGVRPPRPFDIASSANTLPVLTKPRPLARSKPKPKPEPKAQPLAPLPPLPPQ